MYPQLHLSVSLSPSLSSLSLSYFSPISEQLSIEFPEQTVTTITVEIKNVMVRSSVKLFIHGSPLIRAMLWYRVLRMHHRGQ
jgi:hypothetical protein